MDLKILLFCYAFAAVVTTSPTFSQSEKNSQSLTSSSKDKVDSVAQDELKNGITFIQTDPKLESEENLQEIIPQKEHVGILQDKITSNLCDISNSEVAFLTKLTNSAPNAMDALPHKSQLDKIHHSNSQSGGPSFPLLVSRLKYALREAFSIVSAINSVLTPHQGHPNDQYVITRIGYLLEEFETMSPHYLGPLIVLSSCKLLTLEYASQQLSKYQSAYLHLVEEIRKLSKELGPQLEQKIKCLTDFALNTVERHVFNIQSLLS